MSTDVGRRPPVTAAGGDTRRPAVGRAPGALPAPAAVRLRRPGWRDPRLLLGLVLVAGSVLLGTWVLGDTSRTTPVLVARAPLVAGDRLTTDVVDVRDVRLPDAGLYLGPEEVGGVVVRTVGAGEAVPRAAVADSSDLDVRAVGVRVDQVPPGVRAGSLVDVWFVPAAEAGEAQAGAPSQVAEGLVVAEVVVEEGAFAVGRGGTVHVLVPTPELPDVLAAVSAQGTVAVVAVAGGAG